MTQRSLLCGCGSAAVLSRGFCRRCRRRWRLSRAKFGGLRELVLRRDGYQCRCCGSMAPGSLLVHHRRPGVHGLRWLLTLCRVCHVLVHHLRRPAFAVDGLLLELWLEVNAGPVQLRMDFLARADVQLDLYDCAGVWMLEN